MRAWPAAVLLTLLAAPLPAGESQLSASDQNGNFYSVLNLFTGDHEYINIRKLNPGGGNLWTQLRDPGVDQRAAAIVADSAGGVMVASVMRDRGRHVMVLFHYTADGQYDWGDRVFLDNDANNDNNPTTAVTDRDGNYYVAGNCRKGARTVARLWRYDSRGNLVWWREYDNNFNNTYARGLQVDLSGNAYLSVESVQSQTSYSGQYNLLTVTFDTNGNQVSVR
ncbi:MAG: hypothetical protein PHU21_04545 [Elusimicrobia bacterium]|nr:hypothetical protein [Elusimicrobiota bacterium]